MIDFIEVFQASYVSTTIILSIKQYFCTYAKSCGYSYNLRFFLGIYIEAVDHYGHRYGVGSRELKDMIKKVDDEIYNLINQMTSLGLDDVSLMVFSDHGMANIQETVDLFKTLDMEDVTALIPEGSTVKIWPKPGLIDKVN